MLYLVGLGLWNQFDITVRGLDIARSADKVYIEAYTSFPMGMNMEKLETFIGKKVGVLNREDVEVNPKFIDEAKNQDIVVFFGGDPLVATTHHDLILRADKKGVKTRIIHNASIISAIGETGLHIYKFGKTVTIPFWTDNYKPTSFIDGIYFNKKNGLHTLVLLDIDRKNNRYMRANEALKRIKVLDKDKLIDKVIVVARLGSPDQVIKYGPLEDLINKDFGGPLHSVIIPGKLHILEEEYIMRF